MDKPKVNDGGGLYDNEGICDKAILICNDSVKAMFSGDYVGFCDKVVQVVRILANLKNGIKTERESNKQQIDDLKRIIDTLEKQITGVPVEKDGGTDGNCN